MYKEIATNPPNTKETNGTSNIYVIAKDGRQHIIDINK
jgi:hypothetical protein